MSATVEQCLHGYSDKKGHHKIAASCYLQYDSEQTMLRMSDRSGTFCEGFDEYLTLYSLDKYYALAKTWEAREIRRPGCVWTHTILFPEDLKNKIQNLFELTTYLKRPIFKRSLQMEANSYQKRLSISLQNLNKHIETFDNQQQKMSDYICKRLDEKNLQIPILISADSAKLYEEVICAIWSSRKDFSFCTGSLSIRMINKKPLHVQVVPKSLSHLIDDYLVDKKKETVTAKNLHIQQKRKKDKRSDFFTQKFNPRHIEKKSGKSESKQVEIKDYSLGIINNEHKSDKMVKKSEPHKKIVDKPENLLIVQDIEFQANRIDYESNPKKAYELLQKSLKNKSIFMPIAYEIIKKHITDNISEQEMKRLSKEFKIFFKDYISNGTFELDINFFFIWKKQELERKSTITDIIETFEKCYSDSIQDNLQKDFLGAQTKRKYLKDQEELSFFKAFSASSNEIFNLELLSINERIKKYWEENPANRLQLINILQENKDKYNWFLDALWAKIVSIINNYKLLELTNELSQENLDIIFKILRSRKSDLYSPLLKKLNSNIILKNDLFKEFGKPEDISIQELMELDIDINILIEKYDEQEIEDGIKRIKDLEKIISIAAKIKEGNSENKLNYMLCFFDIGLRSLKKDKVNSVELITISFDPVYYSLKNEKINKEKWSNFKNKWNLDIKKFKQDEETIVSVARDFLNGKIRPSKKIYYVENEVDCFLYLVGNYLNTTKFIPKECKDEIIFRMQRIFKSFTYNKNYKYIFN